MFIAPKTSAKDSSFRLEPQRKAVMVISPIFLLFRIVPETLFGNSLFCINLPADKQGQVVPIPVTPAETRDSSISTQIQYASLSNKPEGS